jgi:hypothetical protein
VNLETDVFGVAKLRMADEAAKIEALRRSGSAVATGKGTMANAAALSSVDRILARTRS